MERLMQMEDATRNRGWDRKAPKAGRHDAEEAEPVKIDSRSAA